MATNLSTTNTLKRHFVGFSTQNSNSITNVRTLYDIQLINADLMTSFMTRVGERVMRPDWGCVLWNYLMEPWTQDLSQKIINEAIRICELDSRTNVLNVQVFQLQYGFRIEINLSYLPWNVISTFAASFEQADAVYYGSSASNLLT